MAMSPGFSMDFPEQQELEKVRTDQPNLSVYQPRRSFDQPASELAKNATEFHLRLRCVRVNQRFQGVGVE